MKKTDCSYEREKSCAESSKNETHSAENEINSAGSAVNKANPIRNGINSAVSEPGAFEAFSPEKKPEPNEGKKSFIQFLKFALIGVSNTLIDMIVSTLVSFLLGLVLTGGWMIYVSKTTGYSCGLLNSYIFNSRWTFKKERKQDAREILSFIAVNLIVLLISFGLIFVFKNLLHLDEKWMAFGLAPAFTKIINGERACMLLSTCICIVVNFIGNKFFVFKRNEKENKGAVETENKTLNESETLNERKKDNESCV